MDALRSGLLQSWLFLQEAVGQTASQEIVQIRVESSRRFAVLAFKRLDRLRSVIGRKKGLPHRRPDRIEHVVGFAPQIEHDEESLYLLTQNLTRYCTIAWSVHLWRDS